MEKLLTTSEVAEILGVSPTTLKIARSTGPVGNRLQSPRFLRLGRSVRYRPSDVERWIADNNREEV